MPKGLRAVVLSTAVLCFSGAAAADVSDSARDAARLHFQAGVAEYQLEHYEKALVEFEAGFTAKPEPAFLFNLAVVHVKLGHKETGLRFYRKYLDSGPAETEVAGLRETIDRLEHELAPPPPVLVEPVPAPVPPVVAPIPAAVIAPVPPPVVETRPPRRRKWPIAVGVTVAGVVVVGLTVGLAVGLSQPKERVIDWSAR